MSKENLNQSINEDRRKLLSLAGVAGAGAFLSPLLSKAAPPTIIEAGSNVDTASYIIFQDSGKVYAKNGMTGRIDFQNADASTVINNTLNSLTSGRNWKEKVVLKGSFSINATINIPSYTILEIQGKLTLNNSVNDQLLQNSNLGGNTQIEIFGGEIDGNGANQSYTAADLELISLHKVTNCIIHDIYLHDATHRSIDIRAFSDHVIVHDVIIRQPDSSYNSVGIMILDSSNITLNGGIISASDDGIALVSEAEGAYLHHITINNFILSSTNANPFRANQANASIDLGRTVYARYINLNDVTISGVRTNSKGMSLFFPSRSTSYLEDSTFSNITINDIHGKDGIYLKNIRRCNFSNIIIRDVGRHGVQMEDENISDVSFSNIKMYDIGKDVQGTGFIMGGAVNQVRNIIIDNILIDTLVNSASGAVRIINAVNSTFRAITIRNIPANIKGINESSPSNYNTIENNDLSGISAIQNRIVTVGVNNIVKNNLGYAAENKGILTANGTDAQTQFIILHGLALAPTAVELSAKSKDATGEKYWTADATNIIVNFVVPSPTGTNNIILSWKAEV